MKKYYKVIIFAAAALIVFSTLGYSFYTKKQEGKKVAENKYQKLIQNTDDLKNMGFVVKNEKEFLSRMHKMANTVIVPEDGEVWGRIEITNEQCNGMILTAKASDFKYKDKYVEILERWKKGDYSKAVEEHNFVWNLLGGTKGKAKAVINSK